ncbi:MAG: DUF4145 domain-containing protein [Candidatus Jorgensenbacteria bacterium]|nr:DUF4145 domain-containing protein [Candidatus Jorgensenbacteria bacterium]
MKSKLIKLTKRAQELEELANEVFSLAKRLSKGEIVQPDLSVKGQRWYRGVRELLVQQHFSGVEEFDGCYDSSKNDKQGRRSFTDIQQYINIGTNCYGKKITWPPFVQGEECFGLFSEYFQRARSLLLSLAEEVCSRELEVVTQLSFNVACDEFTSAEEILKSYPLIEVAIRASGVIARVALERHLLTVVNSRSLTIGVNPPSKKKPGVSDILNTLEQETVINAIQKSELESLFKIGNYCAHPKENIQEEDVKRLIQRGKELSSVIM